MCHDAILTHKCELHMKVPGWIRTYVLVYLTLKICNDSSTSFGGRTTRPRNLSRSASLNLTRGHTTLTSRSHRRKGMQSTNLLPNMISRGRHLSFNPQVRSVNFCHLRRSRPTINFCHLRRSRPTNSTSPSRAFLLTWVHSNFVGRNQTTCACSA